MDFQQLQPGPELNTNVPQTPLPHQSNRRLIVLLVVLGFILLAGGASAYYFYYRPQADATSTTSTQNSNSTNTDTNTNTTNSNSTNVNSNDPEFSFDTGGNKYRYHDLANEITPFSVMTPLATWNDKANERFQGQFYLKTAPVSLAAAEEYCSEHSNDYDWYPEYCYTDVAMGYRNPLSCEKILLTTESQTEAFAPSYSRLCMEKVSDFYNPYDCNQHTTEAYRDQCFLARALNGRYRTQDCSPIKNSDLKNDCQLSVDHTKALDAEQDQLDAANDDLLKAICYVIETPQAISYFPGEGYQRIIQEFIDKKVSFPSTMACTTQSSEERAQALSLLTTDADGDKLSVVFEKAYNGDDTKKDTDGDGFDDYTEVVAGYYANSTGPETRMVGDDSMLLLYALSKCATENNGDISKCF